MAARIANLLVLIAVLLMPLGMQPAPAAPVVHHAASMPTPHCPDQQSKHDGKGALGECTMVCSSALPAADLPRPQPLLLACSPEISGLTEILRGLHPETATPPPKRS